MMKAACRLVDCVRLQLKDLLLFCSEVLRTRGPRSTLGLRSLLVPKRPQMQSHAIDAHLVIELHRQLYVLLQ